MIRYSFLLSLLLLFSCNPLETVESFDENGQPTETFQKDKEGRIQGLKTLYIDGKIYCEENYKDNKLEGLRKIFFPTGKVEIEENYKDGQLNGVVKSFYPEGELLQEANYKKGALEGVVKSYFQEGPIKEEVTFLSNEENGPFKEYHLNGKVAWEGAYINGDNEIGVILQYDESGNLLKKMQCDTLMGFSKCKTIWKADE